MEYNTSEIFNAIADAGKLNIPLKNLTKIVVIGDQSSGKSSLVEALCNISILPKKEGLASKKPVNITLVNGYERRFYVEDEEFYTEESTREKINRLNSSSVTQINVKIVSPDVHNMSFIDTPGLIRMSDEGMDPKKIKEMIIKYLQDKNNIFVIVSAAPTDPATCQALQLVHKYKRIADCLGILTKMDLVENQGKNIIYDMLSGKKYCLGFGWGCAKLRSDRDILNGMTLADSITAEQQYFSYMEDLLNYNTGIPKIKAAISHIQFSKIKENIPHILEEIDTKITDLENSRTFLEKIMNDPHEILAAKLKLIIEKLVGSSIERATFETNLRKNIQNALLEYMNKIYNYNNNYKTVATRSTTLIDIPIFDYHYVNNTKVENMQTSELHDMFGNGNISPIIINNVSLQKAYKNEADLAKMLDIFEFTTDDELQMKKKNWNSYLERYFSGLHKDNTLQDMIYNITEKMIIEYITDNNLDDDIAVKFSEYLVKEIGNKSYESKIKYSINTLINMEEKPKLNIFEMVRQLITIIEPTHFDFIKGWFGKYNDRKIKVELYGEMFNVAYLRSVVNDIAFNCYRIVTVNLVNKMVCELLTIVIGLNKESAIKENELINEKIQALNSLKNILSCYKKD